MCSFYNKYNINLTMLVYFMILNKPIRGDTRSIAYPIKSYKSKNNLP
jgi:hypothetical protein